MIFHRNPRFDSRAARPRRALLQVVTAIGLAAACPIAHAGGPLVSTGGWESFTAGSVVGQQTWLGSVVPPPSGPLSSATIQSATAFGGTKALRVDRQANSDAAWAVKRDNYPTGRFVIVAWDMLVEPSFLNVDGPLFGVDTHDGFGPGHTTPYYTLIGTLVVNARTGKAMYQDGVDGSLVNAANVGLGSWNHFEMVMDFQSFTYTNYVNGVQVSQTGFVDPSAGNPNVVDQFTDADITTFAAFSDPGEMAAPGTAYFDNFTVYDGLPGDFNYDGVVNGSDLPIWKTAFGSTSNAADSTGDGLAKGDDFLIWQRRNGTGIVITNPIVSAVPEPGAAALAIAAVAAASGVRRRLA